MQTIEMFFDCSSPWTYLGFESLQAILSRHPAVLVEYRPILVGGIFNTLNPSVYEARNNPVPAKAAYTAKDLQDWARHVGVAIGQPTVFPVNSVKAMRGAFVALEYDCLVPYARAVFRRYWTELKDIARDEELMPVIDEVGLDVEEFFSRINDQQYKDRLRDSTQELMDRGGFGSPTFFLDRTDMYFGNDRTVLLEAALSHSTPGDTP